MREAARVWHNPPSAGNRTHAIVWGIVLCAGLILLAVFAMVQQAVQREREAAFDSARNINNRIVLSDELRIRSLMASMDKVILVLRQDFYDNPQRSRQALLQRMEQLQVDTELHPRVSFVNAAGDLVLSTALPAPGKTVQVNVADRAYFKSQQGKPGDALELAAPIHSRINGKWAIPLTRRITNRDGSFGGMIVMTLDPALFSTPFELIRFGANASRAIIGYDGFTRIRMNDGEVAYGGDSRKSRLFEELKLAPVGSYTAAATSDGIRRSVSYRAIAPYSIIVVAGTSEDAIEASYSQQARNLKLTGSLIAALIFLLSAVLVAGILRHRKSLLALQASASRYQALFQQTPVMHMVTTMRGDSPFVLDCNDRLAAALGYTTQELIGMPVYSVMSSDSPGFDAIGRVHMDARRGSNIVSKHILRRKDGTNLAVLSELTSELVDGTSTGTVRASFIDISHLEELSDKLFETQQSFHQLIELVPQLVFSMDTKGAITWVNGRTLEYIGRANAGPEQDFEWVMASVHPDDQALVREFTATAMLGQSGAGSCEYRKRRFDGAYLWFSSQITLVRDQHGAATSSLQTSTEIHDRKMSEERTRMVQKMESIGQLTGGMAHDFNNLLAIMIGNLTLAIENVTDAVATRQVQVAISAAQRGVGLVKSLLALASRQPLLPAHVDLQNMVLHIAPLLRHAMGPRVQLVLQSDGDTLQVKVDESGLEAVLLNLTVNARDAMPNGGTLQLGLHATGNMARITLTDNGTGMPAEVLKRATEPFFTTKVQGHGTGLGLAMVAGFVKQSQGSLKIESNPGLGTTIAIFLPLAQAPAVLLTTPDVPLNTTAPRTGPRRILVVDDEPEIAALVRTWATQEGHTVVLADSAADAMLLLTVRSFDVLLTDIVMPGEHDGIALADCAAKLYPAMKVLLMSGYSRETATSRADLPWPLLVKPFQKSDLDQALGAAFKPSGFQAMLEVEG